LFSLLVFSFGKMLGYFDVCFIHQRRIRIFTKELIGLEGTAPLVQQRMDVDAHAAADPLSPSPLILSVLLLIFL
jgi:hypothetical protein